MPRGPEIGSDFQMPYQPRRMIADPNLVETRPRLVENLPLGSLRCLRAWKGLLSHKGSCIAWKTWLLYTFNPVFFSNKLTDGMVHDSANTGKVIQTESHSRHSYTNVNSRLGGLNIIPTQSGTALTWQGFRG